MSRRAKLTDQQREQRRQADRQRLQAAVSALLSSEGWARWVHVRARNGLGGRYSWGNQLLIAGIPPPPPDRSPTPSIPNLVHDPFVATDAQLATVRAFARVGYREVGFSYGCLVLRDRRGDEVHINDVGRAVPAYLR